MTRDELAALPQGTILYTVSRRIARSGMRQVFDVFYMQPSADRPLRWIRIHKEELKAFHKVAGCHASGSITQDSNKGGAFWVNGCGFDRSLEVVESLGRFATGNSHYFQRERV